MSLDYPSRHCDIKALAAHVDATMTPWAEAVDGHVHFITHSMGGLVARALISRNRPKQLGRVVALAPPNQGSEIADLLERTKLYRRFYGPAGLQLGTRHVEAMKAVLGPVDYELGVIAGNRAVDPIGWSLLPKPNDGKVTVEGTKVAGMTAHVVLPATHTFIIRNPAAIRASLYFLAEGCFPR